MKKLITLVMVMGIASLATAGAMLVPSATEVLPGEVVTVQLIADVPANGFGLTVAGEGTAVPGAVNPTLSFLPFGGTPVNDGSILLQGATGSAFGASVAAGQVIYEFTWSADVVGQYTLGAVDVAGAASYISNALTFQQEPFAGTADITVIPEPATMALLGLGALVIRRKK